MLVNFSLVGKSPLLMHADDVLSRDMLSEFRKRPKNGVKGVAGDDRSPPWTYVTYMYHDGEHVCWPSQNLMTCLRQAGARMILKKQKTFKEISQTGLLIEHEHLEFLANGSRVPVAPLLEAIGGNDAFQKHLDLAKGLKFELDVRPVVVGKAKHVRVRPKFRAWEIRGTVEVVTPDISMANLTELFTIAGDIGLGDWRPGCKTPGPYGRFTPRLS